ncbi:uncharacterized protein J4E87_010810 [Alternaria ethzedia]|uniref:uncharacterized protein n=1 Tax=Alternaria ethzedia TaxID=181014 RepID=UPI0020C3AF7C|nr:uncharacterized protein J4E87_010810 [Alternaria ethzedia]KAI4610258.1 hypothetical protein J4E87_010810 [Alternaria ethzedia]
MALTHDQVGAIVASCAGAVLLTIFLILIFVHPVRLYTFSRRKSPHSNPAFTTADEESQRLSIPETRFSLISHFETIGNLVIPPQHRPLPSALDIINRVAIAVALPAGTKPADLDPGRSAEAVEKASWTLIERQDSLVMRESAAQESKRMSVNHMEQLEKLQSMFVIGDGEEDEDWDDADSVDHDSEVAHGFGSGKAMSGMYHAG